MKVYIIYGYVPYESGTNFYDVYTDKARAEKRAEKLMTLKNPKNNEHDEQINIVEREVLQGEISDIKPNTERLRAEPINTQGVLK